nr:putative metal-binding motif-containing protein [Pyxidicoccus fallax]
MARDVDSGKELSKEVAGQGVPTSGSFLVGVLAQEDWGNTVEVEARAFERACDGTPVVRNSEQVTLTSGKVTEATLQLAATDGDGDGYVATRSGGTDCDDGDTEVHPGATERCNSEDDNCDGRSDLEELSLEQSCTNAQSCSGTRRCGDNGEVVCSIPNGITAYPDADQDGHGDKNASAAVFCNGVPTGYIEGPPTDCNDSSANVRPGAMERCNDVDDNCDSNVNEGIPAPGTPCTDAESQCGGQYACDTVSGNAVCNLTQQPSDWVLDEDGDGYGSGTATRSCVSPGAGYITRAGDCREGNPFTYPGAPEICDQEDNNCDNLVEATSVCSNPHWASQTVGAASFNWRSVVTPASGAVGVVGSIDVRALLPAGGTSFQLTTTGCGTNVDRYAIWVDANNGRGYMGSFGGRLDFQDFGSTNCTTPHDLNREIRGLVGIRNGANLEIHGVTPAFDSSGAGSTFIWDGANTLTYGTTQVASLYDVHGVSRNALFAVGGAPIGQSPRIYRFNPSNGQWQRETLPSNQGPARLNGVWVVNEKLAFAVGTENTVLKWDGTAWSKMAFPSDYADSLTSVIAFGASSAYATAYNGRIYRYDGQDWRVVYESTSARFNDIAGTSPANLWVAGENGMMVHWPQWP